MRASIFFGLAISTLALAGDSEPKGNSATAISAAKADASGKKGGDAKATAVSAAKASGKNGSATAISAAEASAKGGKGGNAKASALASAEANSKGRGYGDASASAYASAEANAKGRGYGDASASAYASAEASAKGHGYYDPGHKYHDHGHDDPCTSDEEDDNTDCDDYGVPIHLGWWRGRYYGLYDSGCGFDYGSKKYWVFDPKTCYAPVKVVKPVYHVSKLSYKKEPKVIVFWTQIPGCKGPRCWRKGDYCDGADCCDPCARTRHYPIAPWGCYGDDCYDDGHKGCKGRHCCYKDACNPEKTGNAYASAVAISSASAKGGKANAAAFSAASAKGGNASAAALSAASAKGKNANAAAFSAASANGKNANALAVSAASAKGKNANAAAFSAASAKGKNANAVAVSAAKASS